MNRIARLVGLTAVLLALFLAAVLASALRLQRQTGQLREKVLETRQAQLVQILALSRAGPPPWTDDFVRSLEQALDAQIVMMPVGDRDGKTPPASGPWQLEHAVRDAAGAPLATLHVSLHTPATFKLRSLYQHTALVLLVLALGLIAILIGALLVSARSRLRESAAIASSDSRSDFGSLSHLAKVSVQQGADLERERNERLRAEEDTHFQQILLNRALEEKIQLGRELHDGIIQSLYATGLTFEAAKNQIAANPTEATHQLETGLKALNATIRDVRGYIVGLSPENLRQQSFADAVRSLTQTLDAAHRATFDLRIDESAATHLSETQTSNLLQIVRETLSNSLRHGAATQITIRLHENEGELCLLVQDNGSGFDLQKHADGGHGLSNIQARADHLHARLKVTSTPADGTRIVLTLPSAIQAPA